MKIGLVKTCDILPIQQPEITSCWLHISSKWKGQTLRNGFASIKKQYHK